MFNFASEHKWWQERGMSEYGSKAGTKRVTYAAEN